MHLSMNLCDDLNRKPNQSILEHSLNVLIGFSGRRLAFICLSFSSKLFGRKCQNLFFFHGLLPKMSGYI